MPIFTSNLTETELVNEIIDIARARGINQGELARRVGIRQETLSRARKHSTLRFSTVQQLAAEVGLSFRLVADENANTSV
jgi:DNA-binding Xre family transcriptional regulator